MKHLGDPKKQHKHYDSVKRPWDKDRILQEKQVVQKYGIRRKKELRKAETFLRNLRQRARTLIGNKNENDEATLIKKVYGYGLADQDVTIDTILGLKLESVMERRLQTMLLRKNLANTALQARQFITHGHIAVDGIKVISPSYMVKIHEENKISLLQKSSLNQTFKPIEKKEEPKAKKTTSAKEKKDDTKTKESKPLKEPTTKDNTKVTDKPTSKINDKKKDKDSKDKEVKAKKDE